MKKPVSREINEIIREVDKLDTLEKVLKWTETKASRDFHKQVVTEVVVQDEYTHDVIIPYKDFFLVFDTS